MTPPVQDRSVDVVRLKPDATDVVAGFSRACGLAEPRPRRPTNLVSASASNQSRDLSLPVAAFFNEQATFMRSRSMFQDLVQDIRVSLRTLIRAPLLTTTIVATVGLGIGATTTIFAAIDAALLRPLPYADPGRIVRIYTD